MPPEIAVQPTNRDENWKYANLRALSSAGFAALPAPDAPTLESAARLLPAPIAGAARLVLVDGLFAPNLSTALPAAVTLTGSACTPAATGTDQFFATLNRQHAPQVLQIQLPTNTTLKLEVLCLSLTATKESASHPAIEVEVGSNAQLTLIERHLSPESLASVTNLRLQLVLRANATLQHVRVQQLGLRAQQIETLEWVLHEQAQCHIVSIASGAAAARTTAAVRHVGQHSQLHWNAVVLTEGSQVNDNFVRVDHDSAAATTTQNFRGIAANRSRLAFNGHMYVGAAALGASSDQSLKCLLAGNEAEADVRPQLEIYTDDVRATHGATVGKLDDAMLFYLLSRGIEPESAKTLLKWAFIADLFNRVPLPDLRAQIAQSLAKRMPGLPADGVEL